MSTVDEKQRNAFEKETQRKREKAREEFAPSREWLTRREQRVDFESKVGGWEVVGMDDKRAGNFWCEECQVGAKDSRRFLLHLNSRAHQKKLGKSMRVKRSTVEEVEMAFEKVRKEIKMTSRGAGAR